MFAEVFSQDLPALLGENFPLIIVKQIETAPFVGDDSGKISEFVIVGKQTVQAAPGELGGKTNALIEFDFPGGVPGGVIVVAAERGPTGKILRHVLG